MRFHLICATLLLGLLVVMACNKKTDQQAASNPATSLSASFTAPVMIEGKTPIPASANAIGTVIEPQPRGKFKGEGG